MTTMKTPKNLLLVILLCLTACAPSTTPSKATATPAQSPILTVDDIEVMVSNPNYLIGCKSLSKTKLTEQINYRGVVPGKSTHEDVINLLGEPNEKTRIFDQWLYYNEGMNILFTEGGRPVVEMIDVYNGTALHQMSTPLLNMVQIYGCPEIIYAYDPAIDNLSGRFEITVFAYPTIGFEFSVPNYPTRLDAKPDEIIVFSSESLSNYLSEREWLLDLEKAKMLSWDEAVDK